jgi:hypothetical protein
MSRLRRPAPESAWQVRPRPSARTPAQPGRRRVDRDPQPRSAAQGPAAGRHRSGPVARRHDRRRPLRACATSPPGRRGVGGRPGGHGRQRHSGIAEVERTALRQAEGHRVTAREANLRRAGLDAAAPDRWPGPSWPGESTRKWRLYFKTAKRRFVADVIDIAGHCYAPHRDRVHLLLSVTFCAAKLCLQ